MHHRLPPAIGRPWLRCAAALLTLTVAPMTGARAAAASQPLPPQLITEVLDIASSLQARSEAPGPAEGPQTLVYVDNPVPRLQLLQMTLQIDDRTPIYYTYGLDESLALQTQAIHRLAAVAMSPGPHKLYAEYVARYPEDRPGTPRLRSRLIQTIEQADGSSAVQITLAEQSFGREPAISLRQWTPAPGGYDEAELHAIDLDIATGRELRAASELSRLQRRNGSPLPADFAERLRRCISALQAPGAAPAESFALLQQYQAAVAAQDLGALARIGNDKAETEAAWTIRDKANAALGYALLDQGQGQAADQAFRRVRSPGPESSAALLGLGWAQLAPRKGEAPKNAPAAAVKTALGTRPSGFSSAWASAGPDDADRLRRAIVPWVELIGRDPTDEAVQESMLALPYAMDHLGAHRQALSYAQRAVDQLEHTRSHLDRAITQIASGQMEPLIVDTPTPANNGWTWWLAALPDPRWWLAAPPNAPDNFYLERLLGNDEFRAQLITCRRLFELDQQLNPHQQGLVDGQDSALQNRIDSLRAQLSAIAGPERQRLRQIATEQIKDLQRQTDTYLVEAHYAVARMNDRPPTRSLQ